MNIDQLRRFLHKPPAYIVRRLALEVGRRADRWRAPARAQRWTIEAIAAEAGDRDRQALWERLASRPYATQIPTGDVEEYQRICPDDLDRVLQLAEKALRHEVDLLGSGPTQLGEIIDWSRDFKVDIAWPNQFCASIEYNNPDRPSDVKVPWDLSRMQWAIPLGQAYILTKDEKYAHAMRDILVQWIDANPYAFSVNWSCTMEVALRILTWTWFFHVFAHSQAWQDAAFRSKFLSMLYLHGDFTARHLERADINGNHYTADAAGLVFAGLFFGAGAQPSRWLDTGWRILESELGLQVFPDGVDFEASVPYHRLVQELFLLPALYRERCSQEVSSQYRERVCDMAGFTAAYSRNDGSSPLMGDADDARSLPFGGQEIGDHRYLVGIVGALWDKQLLSLASGPLMEAYWLLGAEKAAAIARAGGNQPQSEAFAAGGFYVMRNPSGDHVFIDCGPLGMAGRGGHGHNDLLSFEAALNGVNLVSDCGAYVYTASYEERNRFRSTAYHNTPQVGGEEINRYIHPSLIWTMHNDAAQEVREWSCSRDEDVFVGAHSGYRRFAKPVTPVRTIRLKHAEHRLEIVDGFEGETDLAIRVPLHLAPGVNPVLREDGKIDLEAQGRRFRLTWDSPENWRVSIEAARVSPSYGKVVATHKVVWDSLEKHAPLRVTIAPLSGD